MRQFLVTFWEQTEDGKFAALSSVCTPDEKPYQEARELLEFGQAVSVMYLDCPKGTTIRLQGHTVIAQ